MAVAVVTGSGGLVGAAVSWLLLDEGFEVFGIDNDYRKALFGEAASVVESIADLQQQNNYRHHGCDIRDDEKVYRVLTRSEDVELVVHCAAQPSHDLSSYRPLDDFEINTVATAHLLNSAREACPDATFVFMSTNKVYGDWINTVPTFEEHATRYDVPKWAGGRYYSYYGVRESAPIDRSMHSPFGAHKLAADLMVQEYGRYYGMNTCCFRCGCITGEDHRGVELHGFLAYLAKCFRERKYYTVFGWKGKQVRDNLHADDLAAAVLAFHSKPRRGAVYNMGGGRASSCSILEAKDMLWTAKGYGPALQYTLNPTHRKGDHQWWITDTRRFQRHYPSWTIQRPLETIIEALAI